MGRFKMTGVLYTKVSIPAGDLVRSSVKEALSECAYDSVRVSSMGPTRDPLIPVDFAVFNSVDYSVRRVRFSDLELKDQYE